VSLHSDAAAVQTHGFGRQSTKAGTVQCGCSLPLAPFAGSKGKAVVGAGVALPVREVAQDHRLGKRVCVGRSHVSAGQFHGRRWVLVPPR
jgi:hypothetical protein